MRQVSSAFCNENLNIRYNRQNFSRRILMRPDWDSYFMKIAYAVSERSTCDRAFVGAVLVLEKRILTTGFNGSPAGQSHCDEVGHLLVDGHCIRTIHAETNAIIQAALHGVSTDRK